MSTLVELAVPVAMLVAALIIGTIINTAAEKNMTVKELLLGKPTA